MKMRSAFRFTRFGLGFTAVLVASAGLAGNTDIANEPLSQAASGVRPNIMYILDASGSMNQDYTPDFVNDAQDSTTSPTTTASCFDSGDDDSGAITGTPDPCIMADPPYTSPDLNTQYYNPSIFYRPGVNADGTEKTNMNAANTSNWTAVPTDPFGQQQRNQLNSSQTTEDLVNHYPDRAWCLTTSNSATDTTNCRVNSSYSYPDYQFNRSPSSGKYRFGSPYYYRMQSAQWCNKPITDPTAVCHSGTNVDPNVDLFIAPEFCTDSELVNCAAGPALTPQHVFSGPRWCSDKTTLINCQRKKIGAFLWPKHLGVTKVVAVTLPGTPASATVTITSAPSGQTVTGLTVGGVNVLGGNITANGSTSNMASAIAASINGFTSSPDYTAAVSGSTVTISATTAGVAGNGKTIVLSSTVVGTVAATASITVGSSSNNNTQYVDAVFADHPTLGSINIMSTSCSGSFGNGVSTTTGGTYGNRLQATGGTNSGSERTALAAGIASCINQATASTGFSATASGSAVTVSAPVSLGDAINTHTISVTKVGGSFTTTAFSGGQSVGVTASTSGSTSGGTDVTNATIPVHAGRGKFSRVDIVSTNNAYPKASTRVDCAGSTTCTYAEEMNNFANWYSYYRTRLQMMKSAAGRAFMPIDDTYKVGFITIKPYSNPNLDSGSVDASRYLKIAVFDATQKSAWYTKFYAQTAGGATPLRQALSRVGRLYAGKFDGINTGIPSADDPVDISCQPNFAILSTDGYWNGTSTDPNGAGGVDISGNALRQQDNVNVGPYSLQTDGVFDGGSNTTVGLADVALYYYQTDLRPSGSTNAATGVDVSPDNVPTTQFDFAPHQHMTTFTLGLGLDGTLTFRSDYETANSGDFFAIKQGTIKWPNPVHDAPSALDDLWHTAVNGRGVFFSASNPQSLANSLASALDALKKRVGAGAAAATSNLQPVAGDNFAFTAQYQTQDWIGDVKARTIDLGSGAISSVELWSAQAQLNSRQHTTRILYTFDPTDAYNSTSTGAVGNQLKHFCAPTALGSSPWCTDGTGLTVTELGYFNPNQLAQSVGWSLAQTPNATAENVVNFLRGYEAFEDQGNASATDLFRNRTALLGDIINAQPAYVRASPFNYNDPGYTDFKSCTEGTTTVTCPGAQFPTPTVRRRPTVYIAANDGMLHAIETDVNNSPYYQTAGIATADTTDDQFSNGNNTGNGAERWSYIPGMVLPSLYKLAEIPYSHTYYVDGSPTVGDICLSTPCAGVSDWRTIIVGGLNSGGRGYYALDVTNPLAPRALWEFKVRKPSVTPCATTLAQAVGAADDCDLGLSFGDPIVTKLKATGQWVVIVSSGLNNSGLEPGTSNRQGDGGGYLYILNALTGTIIQKIPTNVGSPGTAAQNYTDADPSGLARINNWVDNALIDNTSLAIYGGDMKGNLWRFDLDDTSGTYLSAVKVATLTDPTGVTPQPITTKPELGLISSRRVIFVGTGRFLGVSDKVDTTQQTIYAIADDLTGNTAVTSRTPLVQQTITQNSPTTRTVSSVQTVDWSNSAVRGWFIDLPDTGERVNVDPQLQLGTLVVASNVPSTDTCVAGGTAWINTLDFKTGGFVEGATNNAVSQKISASVAVGINVIQLPGGKVVTIVTTADNQQLPVQTPVAPTSFQGKRVGWRELTADQ
jgi:type IV pilus assembly protein PilY1